VPPSLVEQVNVAIVEWQQGDVALEEKWFLHAADPKIPLTAAAKTLKGMDGPQYLSTGVEGLVIVTQTCDIIRDCNERSFLEVCPLVKVDQTVLNEIRLARRPNYVFIPGTAKLLLVADLDRTMTIEKGLICSWKRTAGCTTDAELREFATALARKRQRFAFPDDFNVFTNKLQSLLKEKHGKQSPQGEALRALNQIRIKAAPAWNAKNITLVFYFIMEENAKRTKVFEHYEKWMQLIPASSHFNNVEGVLVFLEDMKASDYVESDPLDLDNLSIAIPKT